MTDVVMKELEDQFKLMAKRRDELKDKQTQTEMEYQALLEKMGAALLEDVSGSSKIIETFKRDVASAEAVRSAIEAALSQVTKKINGISTDLVARKTVLAKAEITTLADDIYARARDVVKRLYGANGDIEALMKSYNKVKELAGPLNITIGTLLEPDINDAVEGCKWFLNLNLAHKLSVVAKNHPALTDGIKPEE